LGEYVVNYQAIAASGLYPDFDLTAVEGFHETVQDSINEFWNKLGSLVKKGLTGSLSNTEVK